MSQSSLPSAAFHLLGEVDFARLEALQDWLVDEKAADPSPGITVLLAEHEPLITVGRCGSRGHIRWEERELVSRKLPVRWLARGGGCIPHGPGQLAIYPIVPLAALGWSVGGYLRRLAAGLAAAISATGITPQTRPGRFGLWGRTGLLAAIGVAVRGEVACFGAYLNVHPAMQAFQGVDTDYDPQPGGRRTMGSLMAERGRMVRMQGVRSLVVEHLAAAFDQPRFHLLTGHPQLDERKPARIPARAS